MLITKTSPVGIDYHIQQLQTALHSKLSAADYWNMVSAEYKCYGRCYRNKNDNGYIAENYEGTNEYREVYWDDTLKAISFFGISRSIEMPLKAEADVHLVFFVNLAKIKAAITHRADEEARNDVLKIIGNSLFGFTIQSVDLWLENVLREYPGSRRDNRLAAVDMHPVHCFRINLKLSYNTNKIC